MKTFVLILVMQNALSNVTAPSIVTVPGYENELACSSAGIRFANRFHKSFVADYTCIPGPLTGPATDGPPADR